MIFQEYLQLGFLHVLPWGYDHVLLILALFLSDDKFKRTLMRSAIFTLAHSITLALAYLKVFEVNVPLIEAFIALSIFLYALVLMQEKMPRFRHVYILFVFGLLHGLGFATALSAYQTNLNGHFAALIGFNFGVEMAQLVVLLALFTFFKWVLKQQSILQSKLRNRLLLGIAAIGLMISIQRCILLF